MSMRALLASTMLVTASAAAQAQVVNIFNWSDYIDPEILEMFTAETGIQVVYDVYDSNEVLETRLLAGGSGFDIVVPTGTFLKRQIEAGVYQPLDKSRLPNLVNMWPTVTERTAKYDPDNRFSINYMWGTTGLGYNVAMIRERLGIDEIDSWDVLFNPENAAKLADCGIHVLDTPEESFRAAMAWLGLDPDSTDVEDYRKAADAFMAIRPHIEKFHSSEYINALANGDICLALGWSGDILQARDRAEEAGAGVEIGYAIPAEGAMMWFDNMAIPADAPNPENAHVFLDFIMRPEMIAMATNYVFYANGNLASKPFIDEDVLNDPAIYPSDEVMEKLFVVSPFDTALQRQVTRLWTQVRTGS